MHEFFNLLRVTILRARISCLLSIIFRNSSVFMMYMIRMENYIKIRRMF